MKSLHGHEIINFIKDSDPLIEKENLLNVLNKRFGDAKFYTCSKSGLSVKELVDFLEAAGKMHVVNGKCVINSDNICDDD